MAVTKKEIYKVKYILLHLICEEVKKTINLQKDEAKESLIGNKVFWAAVNDLRFVEENIEKGNYIRE